MRDLKGRFKVDIPALLIKAREKFMVEAQALLINARRFGILPWVFVSANLIVLLLLSLMLQGRPTQAEVRSVVQEVVHAEFISLGVKIDADLADLRQNLQISGERLTTAEIEHAEFVSQREAYDRDYQDVARQRDLDRLAQNDNLTNLGLKIDAGFVDLRQNLQISEEGLTAAEIDHIVRQALFEVPQATVVDIERVVESTLAQQPSLTSVSDLPASWQINREPPSSATPVHVDRVLNAIDRVIEKLVRMVEDPKHTAGSAPTVPSKKAPGCP